MNKRLLLGLAFTAYLGGCGSPGDDVGAWMKATDAEAKSKARVAPIPAPPTADAFALPDPAKLDDPFRPRGGVAANPRR